MDLILTSAAIIGQVLADAFSSPYFLLFFLLIFIVTTWQYRKNVRLSDGLRNGSWAACLPVALVSMIFGLLSGLIGSLLLLAAGVDLSHIAIVPLWITALLLMFINPRFLCFAYAGGILALSSLFLGWPQLSIPDLMALIAVLHMLESLLIALDGHLYAVPVYIQREEGVCGGFSLQKFWPLVLAVIMQGQGMLDSPVPVLGGSAAAASIAVVLAVLGYGEVTTAFTPVQKSRRSARRLFAFSAVLLLLAFLSVRWTFLQYLAAVFSPLGHEAVIWTGLREERKKSPIYMATPGRIMILSLQPGSPAARAGLRSGDIIRGLDGCPLHNNEEMKTALTRHRNPVRVEGQRDGRPFYCSLAYSPSALRGIIPVPDQDCRRFLVLTGASLFEAGLRTWRRLTSFIRRAVLS